MSFTARLIELLAIDSNQGTYELEPCTDVSPADGCHECCDVGTAHGTRGTRGGHPHERDAGLAAVPICLD